MGTRVPVQDYHDLRSASSYLEGSLHDLNADDSRHASEINGVSDVDREAVSEGSLEHDADSNAVDCMNESYRNSFQFHGVVSVKEDPSGLESIGSLKGSFDTLTIHDVSPIESARVRFLRIVVDHFIVQHVTEVLDSGAGYIAHHEQDELHKRKAGDIRYEGDSRFVLPLMYVANMYETLVNEANLRLASLDGYREKTIGVALEAAGGLYRNLARMFPKKGSITFRRRELATSVETRTRFPELVVQEEKRVRFVVVNGLDIVEKPSTMSVDDAAWFKKLTGRGEVSISAQDYKFYSPRHKYRRVVSNPLPSLPGLPAYSGADSSSPMASPPTFPSIPENQQHTTPKQHITPIMHQPQFHSVDQSNHPPLHNHETASPFPHDQCMQPSRLPDLAHTDSSPTIPQTMASLHSLAGSHSVGRMHMMQPTSPAKFCDECGTPYFRETSKFCSECGTKRLGI